jgi:tetratricopeptide (TPR) repeat protein
MMKVTSLTHMPERELDRWILRIAAIFVVGLIAFGAFYFFDRYRAPSPSIVDRSITTLEEAVRTNPDDVVARGQLADTYYAAGRYEDAIAQYDAIIVSGNELELAHFGRAKARQALGELEGASTDFLAVVDIAKEGEMAHVDPMLNAAYFGLGSIALEQGRAADAVEHLTAAVNIKRADADSLNLLGTALLETDEPEQAIDALMRAIAFVPIGWTEPYLTLAEAYEATGQAARAEWALAMADLSSGQPLQAEARLLAITEGETALDAAIGLALVKETTGDSPAAAEWYRRALEIDPENAAARLGLTRVAEPDAASEAPLPELPMPGQGEGGTN